MQEQYRLLLWNMYLKNKIIYHLFFIKKQISTLRFMKNKVFVHVNIFKKKFVTNNQYDNRLCLFGQRYYDGKQQLLELQLHVTVKPTSFHFGADF